jgi:putative endonuclease
MFEWCRAPSGRATQQRVTLSTWFVYMLRCADNSLYTGITNNLEKRLKTHNEGKGAKYTRGRGPVVMVYQKECESKSDALKQELAMKKLTTEQKRRLLLTIT